MSLTIRFNDALAARLRTRASTRQTSPEEFTEALVQHVLDHMDATEACNAKNRRRGELIRKSITQGLTQAETRDLEQLNAAADNRAEPWDRQLLDFVRQLEEQAANLPGG